MTFGFWESKEYAREYIKNVTHRCCECGSDNCSCPATKEEVLERALKPFTAEQLGLELKRRIRESIQAQIAELQSELRSLGE